MPRKPRIEYPGAIYHVMNRGDHREDIVGEEADRELFVRTLGDACAKTGWQVHAYCLMRNHFHLVVETPQPNLSAGMQWLLGTYTERFNRRHRLVGHLFCGRFKSLVVDARHPGYLQKVCDYVHLNPVRAKLLAAEQPLRVYRWSSYPEYLRAPGRRAKWVRVDRIFGECGIPKDSLAGRRRFARVMEERKGQEMAGPSAAWESVRCGWYVGDEEFREELLARMSAWQNEPPDGDPGREAAEQKAQRLVEAMLAAEGMPESELARRRKGDSLKLTLAAQLRQETTMTWKWIAARLAMGHWRSAINAVRRARVKGVTGKKYTNMHL